jgi:hypothetical protein
VHPERYWQRSSRPSDTIDVFQLWVIDAIKPFDHTQYSSLCRARDEYDWMDAKHDPIYRVGGSQYWHQLIIQLAVMPENDPNYEFIKKFLRKYSFDEECRLQHVARSSAGPGGAHFADVVIFMKEASDSAEFEPLLG